MHQTKWAPPEDQPYRDRIKTFDGHWAYGRKQLEKAAQRKDGRHAD